MVANGIFLCAYITNKYDGVSIPQHTPSLKNIYRHLGRSPEFTSLVLHLRTQACLIDKQVFERLFS